MNYQKAIEEIPENALTPYGDKPHGIIMQIVKCTVLIQDAKGVRLNGIAMGISPDYKTLIEGTKDHFLVMLENYVLLLAKFVSAKRKSLDAGVISEEAALRKIDISNEHLYWITFLRLVIDIESRPFKGTIIGEMLGRINTYAQAQGINLPRQREFYAQYLNSKKETK